MLVANMCVSFHQVYYLVNQITYEFFMIQFNEIMQYLLKFTPRGTYLLYMNQDQDLIDLEVEVLCRQINSYNGLASHA